MKESKPAIWNPDKAIEGVFCPTCGNWIDDYTGQPENCPKCGQKLSGWIDGRKHPPYWLSSKEGTYHSLAGVFYFVLT